MLDIELDFEEETVEEMLLVSDPLELELELGLGE